MSEGIPYGNNLLRYICNLIDGYTKDSILKEYLQNSDDSGATELVVTFDKRTHKPLIGTKFEVAKGASLLLYNNAFFDKHDFESIVDLGAQGKVEDAKSTGRFGLGFSSSFSISDHPSFVSNGRALWFDVHRSAVSKDKNDDIQGWRLEEDKREIQAWINTFEIGNNQNGTTFRLPFRNEQTKNQSRISGDIFKYTDFLGWCDEWKNNTSHLLFLRNIQKLILQEITEDNETIIHVQINTKNFNEIHKYNQKFQEEFESESLGICEDWKSTGKELPFFTYKHHFCIKYLDSDNKNHHYFEESFAVANGLFRGTDDNLLDQAIKVLKIKNNLRKVLPWAGTAVSLDENGHVKNLKKAHFYTFLHLPMKSAYPVHIHGWFDLDSKRTRITSDGSGDDKDILIEWNRLLFKEGVSVAWAHLIDYIKEDCDPKNYYSFWPKKGVDVFDEYILEGFYKKITALRCFRTVYKQEDECWRTPKDNIFFLPKKSSDKKLFDPFKEHFSIIPSAPSNYIIQGLSDVDIELKKITPEFICNFLKEESEELEFPFALESMPIAMLSKKEWLLSILIFCAELRIYSNLEELPFELTSDNQLNRLGKNKLLDSNPKVCVFENDQSLFLHSDIIEIMNDALILPSSWLEPTLKNYLVVLHEHIDHYEKNKSWLGCLVRLIIEASENEISKAIDELHDLKVICQHDGTFAQLKSDTDSPVLISKEEIPNIGYLVQTGMQLVHTEYIGIYKPLLKKGEHKLITELNSYSLIKHLISRSEEGYDFFEDKDTREYLINLLANDISWLKELSPIERKVFDEIPFIATDRGNIYAKSEGRKLYLSVDFQPPKNIKSLDGKYEIISVADYNQYKMYKAIGFEDQDTFNYLMDIIIPSLSRINLITDKKEGVFSILKPSVEGVAENILEWLANEWEDLTKNLDKDKKVKLKSKLRSSKIMLGADNNLNTVKNYYDPDFFAELPVFLQDKKYCPFRFKDNATQKNWSDFLSELGVSRQTIPKHVVTTIQSIEDKESFENAIELLNYISVHFDSFKEMKYQDNNIFEYVKAKAWVPAEKPTNDLLVPEIGYKKLRKPSELILNNDYQFAGGAYYKISSKVTLNTKTKNGGFTERDIAEKIGLTVNPPYEGVFASFRRLRSITIQPGDEKKISMYAQRFYEYLGRCSSLTSIKIPEDIKEKSIFLKGHWFSSHNVFQTSIKLTGVHSWNDLIANDNQNNTCKKGLKKLDVLEEPSNEYLVKHLHYLPQKQKLVKNQLVDAKAILNHLQSHLKDNPEDIMDIPLLSRTDQLIASDELYINDLPAYKNAGKKNDKLEFCQNQFETLARSCGVVSLAGEITPNFDADNSKKSEGTKKSSWEDDLRSDCFKGAVLRLIYHDGKISRDEIEQASLDEILPSQIVLMDLLIIKNFIEDTWIFDDSQASIFFDTQSLILYLLNQNDYEDVVQIITEFITDKFGLTRDSLFLMIRILRDEFDYKKIQNLLDKKNIKSLPSIIEIDEDISLFGDNRLEEKYAADEDELLKNNIENRQSSMGENNYSLDGDKQTELNAARGRQGQVQDAVDISSQPITKKSKAENDKQSEFNTARGKKKQTQANVEIPPPTTPIKSESANNEVKGRVAGGHDFHGQNANRDGQNDNITNKRDSTKPIPIKRKKLGLNSNREIVSSNDRKPVYVGKEKEIDSNKHPDQKQISTQIGDKGENYVLQHSKKYLLDKLNKFEKAPKNNAGYDVTEVDINGVVIRYIEVKTLSGKWDVGGVALTGYQLKFAQAHDNVWLFVVENINTKETKVHMVKNPVQQATRYMFDQSWKQLAVTSGVNKPIGPKIGDKYSFPSGPRGKYEVSSIESKGKLCKVKLKEIQSGKEVVKKFDTATWQKC